MKNNRAVWIIVVLSILSLVVYVLPFIFHGAHPFGVDTGFYRRYLMEPLVSFPNPPSAGLFDNALLIRTIFDVSKIFRVPADIMLYGGYVAVWVSLAIAFFSLVKTYFSEKIAIIASILFIFSPVQYAAYWFIFWKSSVALILLFLAFIAIKKNHWSFVPLSIGIALTHQTTTIIYALGLAIYLLLTLTTRNRTKLLKGTAVFGLVCLIYLLLNPSFYVHLSNLPKAIFMETSSYLRLAGIPLLFFSAWAIRDFIKQRRDHLPLLSFGIVSLAFPIFGLPFHQRVLVYADIFLLILAAIGIQKLYLFLERTKSKPKKTVVVILSAACFGLLIGNFITGVTKFRPVLSTEEFSNIEMISDYVPEKATILTSARLAPWVHGWTLNQVIAPRLMDDYYTKTDWTDFWSDNDPQHKINFLSVFPQPLFIIIGNKQQSLFVPNAPCVKNISPFIFQIDCAKL